jgi:(R)-amidase
MVKISVAQFAHATMRKPERLATILRSMAEAAQHGADLVLFSELSLTGWCNAEHIKDEAEPIDGPSIKAICEQAKQLGVATTVGFPEIVRGSLKPFNTTCFIDHTGKVALSHRKAQPFDEYEDSCFAHGDKVSGVAKFKGFTVGLVCCFEVEFPEVARCVALAGANLIIAPAACDDDFIPHHVARTRAYENMCFFCYINDLGNGSVGPDAMTFPGGSAIFGPDGRDVLRMPFLERVEGQTAQLHVPAQDDSARWKADAPSNIMKSLVPTIAEVMPFTAETERSLWAIVPGVTFKTAELPGTGFKGATDHLGDDDEGFDAWTYVDRRRPKLYEELSYEEKAKKKTAPAKKAKGPAQAQPKEKKGKQQKYSDSYSDDDY